MDKIHDDSNHDDSKIQAVLMVENRVLFGVLFGDSVTQSESPLGETNSTGHWSPPFKSVAPPA